MLQTRFRSSLLIYNLCSVSVNAAYFNMGGDVKLANDLVFGLD